MSEHAFDPIPDEQQETATIRDGGAVIAPTGYQIDPAAPNAIVTAAQLADAVKTGRWRHEVPDTTLWLNTSFPPIGHTAESLTAVLNAHGVVVHWPNPAGAR